jgi:hypothetical protein
VPYWVRVVVDWAGKQAELKSHMFDGREQAEAELQKIKAAQAHWRTGSVNNPAPYEEARERLPDWLSADPGSIVGASVEGSG